MQKTKKSPLLREARALLLFTVIALFALLALALTLLFPDALRKTVPYTLPDLVGKEVSAITEDDRALCQIVTVYRYDDTPPGTILSQSPLPGVTRTAIPGKRYVTLTLTVSRGSETRPLPDLRALSAAEGEALLVNLGFTPQIERVYARETPETILAQSPAPEAALPVGARVTLTVSRGPLVRRVSVPSCVGLSETEAHSLLEARGLKVGEVESALSLGKSGRVLRQSPLPGTALPEGSGVTLTVSRGTEYAESTESAEDPEAWETPEDLDPPESESFHEPIPRPFPILPPGYSEPLPETHESPIPPLSERTVSHQQ